ncbi:nuclear transport factor 2 family protein [Pseudoalteromonas luteoviolacea]|uniref:nuclear transport factor 2 family protein n=1 Tax=Pseudoalteromonas luteoviolacea TaxID=43657 RepID=UPI001150D4FD|nr:nuclear transport factor 2 family protein [Pseudoalteromonas luteoviolacea]TQF67386.1 nuclear transport factor 2 family protein [Pseudoalteromonas luteoviolacea]
MKAIIILIIALVFIPSAIAQQQGSLTSESLKAKINHINDLQNRILMKGSKVADVDKLFENFTDDFTYVHQVYGGTYKKEHLYNNYVRFLKAGDYQYTKDRYKIISMIAGYNAVSVERQQIHEGQKENHLTVFEFKGDKVSRIIEYWK